VELNEHLSVVSFYAWPSPTVIVVMPSQNKILSEDIITELFTGTKYKLKAYNSSLT